MPYKKARNGRADVILMTMEDFQNTLNRKQYRQILSLSKYYFERGRKLPWDPERGHQMSLEAFEVFFVKLKWDRAEM